jgi:hypothetical protein
MKKAMAAARGASAYTEPEEYPTRALDQTGLLLPGEPTPPRAWADVIDELLRIRKLEDDWDGQGSEAPPRPLVDTAIKLAQSFQASGLRPADFAVAGVNGTVLFEWHDPADYLEIEVTAPDIAEGRLTQRPSRRTEQFRWSG